MSNRYYIDGKRVSQSYFEVIDIIKKECGKLPRCKACDFSDMCTTIKGIPKNKKIRVVRSEQVKNRGFEVVEDKYRKHPNIDIQIPKRSTKNSAGYDICTPVEIRIPAGGISEAIQTDIKAYMLADEVLEIYPRSSLGFKKGLMLINTVGIIDSDYYSNLDNDGNIGFKLKNLTDKEIVIEAGEKIMQGIFKKYLRVDNDNSNEARIGGIGSTGK